MIDRLEKLSDNKKYDPWEVKQSIAIVKIVVHCSRYWMLSEWECANMSFPFWRIYHSTTGGSFVCFNGIELELKSDKLILIPPNCPFSTYIKNRNSFSNESIVGKIISKPSEVEVYRQEGLCDQLFVHFNLGFPYDKLISNIYEIEIDDFWNKQLNLIRINRLELPNDIDLHSNFKISGLILYALEGISANHWAAPIIDKRVLKVISFIDKNINTPLSNIQLSKMVNLSTNSFARLFRLSMKCSIHKYIQLRRIEHAIMILHHSNKEIEDIALECGFYDRHHFSKIFKKQTGISPARYRQRIRMEDHK